MTPDPEVARLRKELVGLFNLIQRIRKELAAIRKPGVEGEDDHFNQMSDQLDAIVETTEEATNTIMEQMEAIEDLVQQARQEQNSPKTQTILDQITDRSNVVFEACAFQDLTGQRVTKVVRTLKFIEERVNRLMQAWGAHALAQVKVEQEEKDPDKALLHGPQRKSEALRQDDVDSLFGDGAGAKDGDGDDDLADKEQFNQDDIDKLFG